MNAKRNGSFRLSQTGKLEESDWNWSRTHTTNHLQIYLLSNAFHQTKKGRKESVEHLVSQCQSSRFIFQILGQIRKDKQLWPFLWWWWWATSKLRTGRLEKNVDCKCRLQTPNQKNSWRVVDEKSRRQKRTVSADRSIDQIKKAENNHIKVPTKCGCEERGSK